MTRINSRAKGKRIELEARDALNARFGLTCRRAQQYRGVTGAADLAGVPGLAVEVKARRSFAVLQHVKQAAAQAAPGGTPVVLLRPDRGGYYVLLRLEDWSHPGLAAPGSPADAWDRAVRSATGYQTPPEVPDAARSGTQVPVAENTR